MANVKVKRVYEEPSPTDGYRVLVDRVWPRGVSKETAAVDEWLKSVAPSTELRKWFGHDPAKWTEFRRRYFAELAAGPEGLDDLQGRARASGTLTLVYSARDTERNQAVALREWLMRQREGRRAKSG